MRYQQWHPPADLASRVHCIWELEAAGSAFAEPIFPDGRVEIVVHLADRPRRVGDASVQPDVLVIGQMTAALRLEPAPSIHAIGVRFTPAGARAWLHVPLHEITDRTLAAGDLAPRLADELRRAVEGSGSGAGRAAAIIAVLRHELRSRFRAPQSIEHAVRVTLQRGGRVSVDALGRECGIGARQLERQYRDAVGLSPKALARTVRFHRALRHLQRGEAAADVAALCGFADQPHLAREFRRFAGAAARDVNLARVAFVQDGPAARPAD